MSSKPKQIVGCKLFQGQLGFRSMEIVGGPNDGTVWRTYEVTFNDGSTLVLWAQDGGNEFYKQVFVPWNFEHPSIL